jgi:polysaccharide biosynthesis protein PslH
MRMHVERGRTSADTRPRVLYITNQLPYPPHSGGQVREEQLLRRLGQEIAIDLLVLTEHFARDSLNSPVVAEYCAGVTVVESTGLVDSVDDSATPDRVRRCSSHSFGREIARRLDSGSVDLIHVEGYFLLRHVPDTAVPIVLAAENIEYQLDRDLESSNSTSGPSWRVSRKLERAAWLRASLCVALSKTDLDCIEQLEPQANTALVPNGFDHISQPTPRSRSDSASVLYFGNYSWPPTYDGAVRLLSSIWPQLIRLVPEVGLTLCGADMPESIHQLGTATEAVAVLGHFDSASELLNHADVFVCPIGIGSGTKVKLIEAFRSGCPVVTTPQALAGFPPAATDAVAVADSDAEFVAQARRLLEDRGLREELGRRGAAFAASQLTWDQAGELLLDAWKRATGGPPTEWFETPIVSGSAE